MPIFFIYQFYLTTIEGKIVFSLCLRKNMRKAIFKIERKKKKVFEIPYILPFELLSFFLLVSKTLSINTIITEKGLL